MRRIDGNRLIAILKDTEMVQTGNASIRRYSGRGMYGDHCVGVTINRQSSPLALGAQMMLACDDEQEAMVMLVEATSQDGMGIDSIVYWTAVEWPDGVEEGEDDE